MAEQEVPLADLVSRIWRNGNKKTSKGDRRMAIRVIKQGTVKKDSERILRGKCDKCRCELECDRAQPGVYEEANGRLVVHVDCPTEKCGRVIAVRESISGD